MVYWLKGTEVNRLLGSGFTFISLEVRLCLMFTVDVGIRLQFCFLSLFLSSVLPLSIPRNSILNRVGVLLLSVIIYRRYTGALLIG